VFSNRFNLGYAHIRDELIGELISEYHIPDEKRPTRFEHWFPPLAAASKVRILIQPGFCTGRTLCPSFRAHNPQVLAARELATYPNTSTINRMNPTAFMEVSLSLLLR